MMAPLAPSPTIESHRSRCANQAWELHAVEHIDVAAVKQMFRKLHAFNSALDPRFALSEVWETRFDAAIEQALLGDETICLIAYEATTRQPCGFALAAVHHDSDMWRYHEWVEVEALYVEDAWHGRGLAEALLCSIDSWADSQGQTIVQLYVTASNERAIRFYQHEGFQTTQEIMRKSLA